MHGMGRESREILRDLARADSDDIVKADRIDRRCESNFSFGLPSDMLSTRDAGLDANTKRGRDRCNLADDATLR